ncbi:hypothetical protein [Flavobacterium sp.]|uniref:hypothetical protein n=1 Tax=Flavobacterium sp. TaxID=239 RepID=UPI0026338302|nr:hypothetical protein [Flavobacterium sp.]
MEITIPGASTRLLSVSATESAVAGLSVTEINVQDREYWELLIASAKTKEGVEYALDQAETLYELITTDEIKSLCDEVIAAAQNTMLKIMAS